MDLKTLYTPIEKELSAVETWIQFALLNSQYAPLRDLNAYVIQNKGKKIRVALLLLFYKALLTHRTPGTTPNFTDEDAIVSAAVIECIHNASLVHDDIIDEASTRHQRPSVYAKFGRDFAIIEGVYMYSAALQLMSAEPNRLPLIPLISSCVNALCEGEFHQMNTRHNWELTFDDYMAMVDKKTSRLFAVACQFGAIFATTDPQLQQIAYDIGLNLGHLFQITDDYLDVFSDEAFLKKTPGQDLLTGDLTLPVIYLLEAMPAQDRESFIAVFTQKSDNTLSYFQARLTELKIEHKMLDIIQHYTDLIQEKLKHLHDSAAKESIDHIITLVSTRCLVSRT